MKPSESKLIDVIVNPKDQLEMSSSLLVFTFETLFSLNFDIFRSNKTRRSKILALVLAGGEGGRLDVLTEQRAKPAVPFGGSLRLIDFSMSNCRHSHLPDVWIIEQYELHELNEHLANGRPWDMDRTYGGLQILPPFENHDKNKKDDGKDKDQDKEKDKKSDDGE